MEDTSFSEIGRIEAINQLIKSSGYEFTENAAFLTASRDKVVLSSVMMVEGIDFDLTYFPLKHLGYKAVILAVGKVEAGMGRPVGLSVRIALSAKLDFPKIKELWEGMVTAAKEHGVTSVDLDLVPSPNGLYISVSATGRISEDVTAKRPRAKSMDLICVSGNLGGAFMGLQVLEREKARFMKTEGKQPELADYKHFVGEYLKPELNPEYVRMLTAEGIVPSFGYFIDKGLGDALKKLVRDSGLGAKVYVERIPFMSGIFDLGKELGIDPISAAFNGGDDCRLLFTIPIGSHEKFRHDFQTFDIIGHLAKPDVGAVLVTPDGVELPVRAQGWK